MLRFDYMGNGDSEGCFQEVTLDTMVSDAGGAVAAFREKTGIQTVNLLGLRMGASIASLAAERRPDVKKLILWEPVLYGSAYMRELMRINLATQASIYKEILHSTEALIAMMREGKTVNVDGYEMSGALYDQVARTDLTKGGVQYDAEVLIVQIGLKAGGANQQLEELKRKYRKCDITASLEEPFWKETRRFHSRATNLYETTMNWVEGNGFGS